MNKKRFIPDAKHLVPGELSQRDADAVRWQQENAALKAAALDVVKRWHSPQWKWDEHTGVLIKRLADAAGIDINEL